MVTDESNSFLLQTIYDALINFFLKMLLMVIFVCILSPVAMAMRLLRRDFMKRRLSPESESYWEEVHDVPSHFDR